MIFIFKINPKLKPICTVCSSYVCLHRTKKTQFFSYLYFLRFGTNNQFARGIKLCKKMSIRIGQRLTTRREREKENATQFANNEPIFQTL